MTRQTTKTAKGKTGWPLFSNLFLLGMSFAFVVTDFLITSLALQHPEFAEANPVGFNIVTVFIRFSMFAFLVFFVLRNVKSTPAVSVILLSLSLFYFILVYHNITVILQ